MNSDAERPEDLYGPGLGQDSPTGRDSPIGQADELFSILKSQGRTTEYIRFEGESHGLSRGGKPLNRLERLDRIVDWFRRYL